MTDTTTSSITHPRAAVQAAAAAWAIFELAIAYWMEAPIAAVAFGMLFAIGAWWAGRPGIGGLVFVAALAAIELAFLPFYPRDTTFQWTTQITALALGVVAVIACAHAARTGRRR